MTFNWTTHHFVAGALCLDFANTVVYPDDADRREDRLGGISDIRWWGKSAERYSARDDLDALVPGHGLRIAGTAFERARKVRKRVDRVFRTVASGREIAPEDFQRLMRCYADAVREASVRVTNDGVRLAPRSNADRRGNLLYLVTQSAVSLAFSPTIRKVKICPGCGWLFADHSKGGRRVWCEMRTCGNRAKARRRYYRARSE